MLDALILLFEILAFVSMWRFMLCFLPAVLVAILIAARTDFTQPMPRVLGLMVLVIGVVGGWVWQSRHERRVRLHQRR